jgi:hypothetical protein
MLAEGATVVPSTPIVDSPAETTHGAAKRNSDA